MDWDDLRFVLAVSRTGSALGAARALGVNQSTVVRRLAQVEAAAGAELFDRKRTGYCFTDLGRSLVETAERVEVEMQALQDRLSAASRTVSGVVRLTTSERMASVVVAPCVREFRQRYPDVRIELFADDRRLDVARGEADIALRAGSRPEGAGIVARKLLEVGWTVYCSKSYAAEHGAPATADDFHRHAIIGMEGSLSELPGPRWMARAAPDAPVRFTSNSLSNLIGTLRAGLGIATLPCMVGDTDPELVRCMPPPRELDSELWLIVREDLRSVAAVRALTDSLAQHVHEHRAALTGRPAGATS
jgi:DNA-binding transcriptional LysR family regulator